MGVDVTTEIQEDLRWMLCSNLRALDVAAEIAHTEGQPEQPQVCDPAKCPGIVVCAEGHNLSPQMRSAVAHYAELVLREIVCVRTGASDL